MMSSYVCRQHPCRHRRPRPQRLTQPIQEPARAADRLLAAFRRLHGRRWLCAASLHAARCWSVGQAPDVA